MSFPVPIEYDIPDVKYNDGNVVTLPPSLSGDGTGVNLSQLEKDLILTLFSKAAYAENDASIPYDTLENLWKSSVLPPQSITAVYTQSGTVYDTDSLDSLKADLVVTANYEGGTSETIPASNYTLSGTLAVGTSTITVEYAGLTTTFNVVVSVYVDPPAYELASATPFNGTSDYVDTGYVLTNTDKNFSVAIEFEPNAPADGATLFDTSHNGSGAFQFWLQSNGSGNYRGQIVATGVTLFNKSALTTNAKVVFVHTVGESTINAYISLDGGAKQTVAITVNNFGTNANYLSTTQHLILGARYNLTERFFKGTINKFAVYEYVMEESAIDAFLGVS